MASVTINIARQKVYAIAEGVSITISQHNGGTPTYEQLWASPSESPKLDIYYREAIGDLERRLMDWAAATSSQFDLTADGTDYVLTLGMSPYWPNRLLGLLDNKIQDYLVHSVTAGWLNDFDGLSVKQDYQAIASQDILDILEIIHQRSFGFTESERAEDNTDKDVPDSYEAGERAEDDTDKDVPDSYEAGERAEDDTDKDVPDSYEAGERAEDDTDKDVPDSYEAGERAEDDTDKDVPDSFEAGARGTDTKKDSFVLPAEAGFRHRDNAVKSGMDDKPVFCRNKTTRHRDDAPVDTRRDYTDMSGTDMGYRMDDPQGKVYRRTPDCPLIPPFPPTRPMIGMGFTPEPKHPPQDVRRVPKPKIPREPHVYPEPPLHFIRDKHTPVPPPPTTLDYDKEREEAFINSHECGHHDCGHHGIDPLDWDCVNEDND